MSGSDMSSPEPIIHDQGNIPWHLRRYEIYQPPSFVARAPPRYYNFHLLSTSARERLQRELNQSYGPGQPPSLVSSGSFFSGVGSGSMDGSVRSSLSIRRPSVLSAAPSAHSGSLAGIAGLETSTASPEPNASPASTAAPLNSPSLDLTNALNAGPAANHRRLARRKARSHTSLQSPPIDADNPMDDIEPFDISQIGKDRKSGNVFSRLARKLSLIRRRSMDGLGNPGTSTSKPRPTVEGHPPAARGRTKLKRRVTWHAIKGIGGPLLESKGLKKEPPISKDVLTDGVNRQLGVTSQAPDSLQSNPLQGSLAVKERLAEIMRALQVLSLGLSDGTLPLLVDDSSIPTGAVNIASLGSPLSLRAGSSPLMYIGNVRGAGAGPDGAKLKQDHGFIPSNLSGNLQVMQVLAGAISRIAYDVQAARAQPGGSVDQVATLVKQQQVLDVTAQAVADEIRVGPHSDSQCTASGLVVAARSVVVGAAQLVAAGRATRASHNVINSDVMPPTQAPVSITEVSVVTQSAVADAVALNEFIATEVEIMVTANALIWKDQVVSTNEALEASQAVASMLGNTARSTSPQLGQIEHRRSSLMSSLGHPVGITPIDVAGMAGSRPGSEDLSGDRTRPSVNPQFGLAFASTAHPSSSKRDEDTKRVTQQDHPGSIPRGTDMSSPNDTQSLSGRSVQSVRTNEMTSSEVFECLINHGCLDLQSHIHPRRFSTCRVAEGAFGDVWKGQLIDGTDVAIKVLRYALIREDGSKSMKRAMREIYNWSKLEHKNIHKLLGVTLFEGRLGMVSKWMEH
ncbi:hypothetical protein FRC11_004315, partial [Ceratobasidium sp. 423]